MTKYIVALLFTLLAGTQHVWAQHAPASTARLQSLNELSEPTSPQASPKITAWKLKQNTKVLFVENHALPMIDVKVSFAAGSQQDGDSPGIAAMMLSLFNEGTALRDATSLATGFDRLGVEQHNDIDREQSHLSLRSLSTPDVLQPALQLFTEMLAQPGISADAIRRVKSELITQLQLEQDAPKSHALTLIYNELYPDQPIAHSMYGSVDSLERIDEAQLRAFYRRAYTATNAQIVIVGDLTAEQAQTLSQALADALPSGPALALPQLLAGPKASGKTLHVENDSTQSLLVLAQAALPNQHPDALTTRVGHLIFSLMLNAQLREKHSVTYGVLSNVSHAQGLTPWVIDLNTPSQYSLSSMAYIKARFAQFLEQGPTDKALEEVKQYVMRAQPQYTVSNKSMLEEISLMSRFNQPLDFTYKAQQIEKLTSAQVKAAMQRHYSAQGWVSVTAGPNAEQLPLPVTMAPEVLAEHSCRANL